MHRPRLTALLALSATVAVTAACSSPSSPSASPTASSPDGPLRVVGQFEVHSLDPATAGGTFTRLQVAETLVDADDAGVLQPGLAERWEASDDQRSWTFTLRSGAVFHDDTPVTAEQVVAALERARASEGTPLAEVPWESLTAEGDDTVRITLTAPFAALPAALAHTSAQILAESSFGPDGAVTQVVGSGPYRVERVQVPSGVDLVAAEQWQGEEPAVERVTYQVVGRAEARALMAQSGQADVTFGLDPTSLQRVQGDDDLSIESALLPRTIMLKVNAGHEVLGDVDVRKAISLALDRDGIATALLRDPEVAATQMFPPSLPEWHSEEVPPLEHDPEEARALLERAGFAEGPDGRLARDGKALTLTLRTFPDRAELPVVATAVQAALAEIGVGVEVLVGNSSEIPAGHEDGTLELALFSRNFALVPDPLVTMLSDFDADGADFGAMGWSSPTVTAALDELAAGARDGEAAEAREQVASVLQEELPVIPVAWYRQSAALSDRVAGVTLDPLERSFRLTDTQWAR